MTLAREKKTVLVVDDDPEMRGALCEALSRLSLRPVAAEDGERALRVLESQPVHLVLTDLRMPEMDGLTFLRRVRAREGNSVPVVLITAYGRVDDAVESMKAGAFDFIQKPFAVEALEGVVRRALTAETTVGPEAEPRVPTPPADPTSGSHPLITQDRRLLQILQTLRSISGSKVTILISGESGTGKEVVARYIHGSSPRREKRFLAVNCAALPSGLLESELFGYERGAFTGAVQGRAGKFEQADAGTLLLDEVSEIELALQAKLLRVLQESEVDRLGGRGPVGVDVRVIATSNRDLQALVRGGSFRADLFYRLNVFPVMLPPLRERRSDIPLLVAHFLEKHGRRHGKPGVRAGAAALERLASHDFPGNVRELENTTERGLLLCEGDTVGPEHVLLGDVARLQVEAPVPANVVAPPVVQAGLSLREAEKRLILNTLGASGGNRTEAAKRLEISLRTLRNKLREYRAQGWVEEAS